MTDLTMSISSTIQIYGGAHLRATHLGKEHGLFKNYFSLLESSISGEINFFWECYESKKCEIYLHGIPEFISGGPKIPLEEMILQTWAPSLLKWGTLISEYTSCSLTRPEDKLVALSGIVKIMKQTTQDSYYAGLWKTNLPAQLLWRSAWQRPGPLI